MEAFFLEWGNDHDKVRVKNNCKTVTLRDNLFNYDKLKQLEDTANSFWAKYGCRD